MKIYLAGPEVFLPNAEEIGNLKRDICRAWGHIGVFPLDNTVVMDYGTDPKIFAFEIYKQNIRTMNRCDAVIANMTPFRGISMDVGTAFEMGYMAGCEKPVLAYSNVVEKYIDRVKRTLYAPSGTDENGAYRDLHGMLIEDFGLHDNLMLEGAIDEGSIELVKHAAKHDELWTDLTAFEECVRKL